MDNNIIKYDYLRYRDNYTILNSIKLFFREKGFRYTVLMRLYKAYSKDNHKIKAFSIKILKQLIFMNTTIEIPLRLNVGKGLYMGHFSGITINPGAIIREYVNIHKGVTIGQENRGKRKGTPIIGNKVWIGINSTIVGNIRIGNNVMIAPNSFVNFDVPNNSIVVGGKIIKSDTATEGYINIRC